MASLDFEAEKAAFRDFYSENQQLLMDAESFFRSLVSALLANHESINDLTVLGRVKDREEAVKKFTLKYQSDLEAAAIPYEIKDHITDLIGIRVICLYEDEVSQIGTVIKDNFEILEVTDKIQDMESTEDAFGYKGLHMDLKIDIDRRRLPEYTRFGRLRFELQIRTIVQDAWSVLDHKIKYKKSIPPSLKRRINALAAQFETVDHEFLAIRQASKQLEDQGTQLQPSTISSEKSAINAFQFLAIAKNTFPGYTFSPETIDGFVDEINDRDPNFTQSQLEDAIINLRDRVDSYRVESEHNMNPFTMVRHILFLLDRERFNFMLFDRQRSSFTSWLALEKASI